MMSHKQRHHACEPCVVVCGAVDPSLTQMMRKSVGFLAAYTDSPGAV